MAAEAKEAQFKVTVDGNAARAGREMQSSMQDAAKEIEKYEAEIKKLNGDLRRLRGNSDEVSAVKKDLAAKVEKARGAISDLTLKLREQGSSYEEASKAAKKYSGSIKEGVQKAADLLRSAKGDFAKGLSPAAGAIGKPLGKVIAPIKDKLSTSLGPATKKIGDVFGKASKAIGTKLAPAKKAIGSVAGSVKGAASKVSAAVKPLASGVIKAGKAASDAAAKMQRQRQALLGNAEDAKAFGTQITEMAKKVPQGVGELNALAVSLSKTRLSGTAMVNTFKAVSQVTGAVDEQAGSKIQDLITRMQHTGRMAIGQYELDGTGIDFNEVAKEYAAGTKKSVAAAAAELRSGRAPIEAGAEALAKAAEKKFGKMNLENAFSLESAPKKFMQAFRDLSSGLNLGPLSKSLQDAFGQLSPNAPLGAAVKTFMTTLGQGFIDIAAKSIPVLVEGFTWVMVGALKLMTFFYELKASVKEAFNEDGFIGAGKAIIRGIVKGVIGEYKFVWTAMTSLADTIKDAFAGPKGIDAHSPSKAFEEYGGDSAEGYVVGVQRGAQKAASATSDMAQSVMNASSSTVPDQAGATTDNSVRYGSTIININVGSKEDAQELQSPSFISSLSIAVRSAMAPAGAT